MDTRFSFDFTINNSKKAKNLRISLKQGKKVIITKPWFIPQFLAIQFLKENEAWVTKNLAKVRENSSNEKDNLYYLGKKYKIKSKEGKLNFEFKNSILTISAYSQSAAKRSLLEKLKKESRQNIKNSVKKYSQIMGQVYKQVRLKDQSSRWGSASSKSNLNFNWRLIMAPPEVLDYVIIHELAHFKHMNHSNNFWQYVEKFDPEYREHRRWLVRHQNELII